MDVAAEVEGEATHGAARVEVKEWTPGQACVGRAVEQGVDAERAGVGVLGEELFEEGDDLVVEARQAVAHEEGGEGRIESRGGFGPGDGGSPAADGVALLEDEAEVTDLIFAGFELQGEGGGGIEKGFDNKRAGGQQAFESFDFIRCQ